MFHRLDNIDESQIVKSLKDYFNKLNQEPEDTELSDDDNFFVLYYFLELSKAIIKNLGEDFSKKMAKVILDSCD